MKIMFIGLFLFWGLIPKISYCQIFVPDSTVNGVLKLDNFESGEENLGDIMDKVNQDASLPDIYFANKSNTQYLRLIFFPGSTRNSFARFEIGVKLKNRKYSVLKKFDIFSSESKIAIGTSMTAVIKKKGKDFSKKMEKGLVVLTYTLTEMAKYPLLLGHNMPLYSAEYYFKKGKLVKMSYGFEYP
ncbi:MAG: hypothetical protein ABL876_03125 [Chitinophagaceae bacterium]